MADLVSYRQAGRDIQGRLYRGSVVDAYNRLTHPSIPSPTDKILTLPRRLSAFGVGSSRFNPSPNNNPSPGSYNEPKLLNPSLSKKGFGGLTQRENRFKRFQFNTVAPGPGKYDPIEPITNSSVKYMKSNRSLSNNLEDSPSPGHYDPYVASTSRRITSIFKSTSKRRLELKEDIPSPGQYNLQYSLVQNTKPSFFFQKSSTKRGRDAFRSQDFGDNAPGPGTYFNDVKPLNKRPSYMFIETGKKIERTGFGAPGPGYYELEKDKKDKLLVSGAVFMSESERLCATIDSHKPGPAFYHPLALQKRSFHFNSRNNWS